MSYKKTLNLPQTRFSMKANLLQKEPIFVRKWKNARICEKRSQKSKQAFILHDGPPYANGHIHMGHALNKVLKDIINRFRSMQGFSIDYIPGWDCHGLPIEHQVLQAIHEDKKTLSFVEKRLRCRKYAKKFVSLQKKEFQSLGIDAHWDKPYLTMNFSYEANILEVFARLVEKGYIQRGFKPIHWCGHCQTALAEAEIEYKTKNSFSVWVKFPCSVENSVLRKKIFEKRVFFLIWTTTPWTLSSNMAIAVHPDASYVFVDMGSEILICAESRLSEILSLSDSKEHKIVHEMRGKDLEKMVYQHLWEGELPSIQTERQILTAPFVSSDDGTGCVHCAPAHGEDDFHLCQKYFSEVFSIVDEKLTFTKDWPEFEGLSIFSSQQRIVDKIKDLGLLYHQEAITHSYPHCWRCHKPVVFRATQQWFMDIEHNSLRERTLAMIKKVQWIPSWGQTRLTDMIEKRPSWCLSRQRYWGVPIPALYCDGCGHTLLDPHLIKMLAEKVTKKGCDIWFSSSVKELFGDLSCPSCLGRSFSKEKDILDVWFDSGCSHYCLLTNSDKKDIFPADLYLEGSDQHRGWFQSSLLLAMAVFDKSPFKTVLTHNFIVDIDGTKMSKSLGNVTDPQALVKKYGVDVIRLFVASSDFSDDIRISQDLIQQKVDAYRKIRNTCRFFLANTFDFDYSKEKVSYKQLMPIDRWALSSLQKLIKTSSEHYNNFSFYKFYKKIYDFCVVDMSSFYLDILKDRLYTFYPKSIERLSAQTVMMEILSVITRLLSPVLIFTSEELWEYLPEELKKETSVHLDDWPIANEHYRDLVLEKEWERISVVRGDILKEIEVLREEKSIGSSLEVVVTVSAPEDLYALLDKYRETLEMIFIVSVVHLKKSDGYTIAVEPSSDSKCERCWIYSESVGRNSDHSDLCSKCSRVVQLLEG